VAPAPNPRLVSALIVPLVLSGVHVQVDTAASPSVTVATDKSTYRRGESIHLTLRNDLPTTVYVETDQSSGSGIVVQAQVDGRWLPEAAPGEMVAFIPVVPGGALAVVLGLAAPPPSIQGPIVGGPNAPGVNLQDLRTVPVEPPAPLSGPIRERTQGVLPPESRPGPSRGGLDPGTYRLKIKVRIGSPDGPSEIRHSEEFVVKQ
jgi:hypothetical protein